MTNDYAFSIDPNVCLQAHGALTTAAGKIRTLLEEINRDGDRLVTEWSGDAQEAFHRRQQQWTSDAALILDRLDRINAGLLQSVEIYLRADRRGADLIAGG